MLAIFSFIGERRPQNPAACSARFRLTFKLYSNFLRPEPFALEAACLAPRRPPAAAAIHPNHPPMNGGAFYKGLRPAEAVH